MNKPIKKVVGGLVLALIIGLVLFLYYFPHYYALIKTPTNYVFAGQASWFDPWDITNYFAVIRVAQKEKTMLVGNINTTEVVKPAFIYPLYTLAGIVFTKTDPILLYHVLAVTFGLGLAITLLLLAQMLVKNYYFSAGVLVLASLGGGFGFLVKLPEKSADLSIPGVTFLSTFQKPHEALAAILYLSALVLFYRAVKGKKVVFLAISIVSLSLLIPIYPYRWLSFMLITGLFSLFFYDRTGEKHTFGYWGILLGVTAPILLIYGYHFYTSGFAVLTSYQPPPITVVALLLGYGVFGVLCVSQIFFPVKNYLLITFLNIWVIISMFLAVLPFGMSRLFLSGLLFPLAVIAVLFLNEINNKYRIAILLPIILLVFLPTSFYVFGKRIREVKNNNIWFYLPQATYEGIEFLKARGEDGVLALPPLNSYIPALAGKHVYFGIKDQTPDYLNRFNQATLFYQGKLSAEEVKAFLEQNRIHLVVSSDPAYPFLETVFQNKDMAIQKY